MGEELDVGSAGSLAFALFESSIGAARLLGLFTANSSLYRFIPFTLFEISTSRSFLGNCAGLVWKSWGGRSWMFPFLGGADYNFAH